jgi:hypothetical protein
VKGPRPYAFDGAAPADVTKPLEAPLTLTASDGTGLRLVELEARAIVEGPLAFTELRVTFDNPDDRRLEGTFAITLPEGAALGRFAMKIGDSFQEGEVVEKQSARRAYEDFLHRRQDPALLEQAPGNQFTARVFPIPARGRKELIVSYSQELAGGRPYVLPLRGLPKLGRLAVSVTLAGQAQALDGYDLRDAAPSADYELDLREAASKVGGVGLRSGELALVRVHPIPAAEPDPLGPTMLLVDTSASRALGFEEQLRVVARIARRLAETAGARTPLLVGAYDQATETIFEGEAGGFGDGDLRRLRERQAFGASNLGAAIAWAEARAKARGYRRLIVVGDGVATAGDTDAASLGARASHLRAAGVERVDAIVMGGIRDEGALRKLVTAGLARDGVVVDGGLDPAARERKLMLATRSGIPVVVEGARWQWPTTLDGVQAGDEVLVYAEVPEGLGVRVAVGGATSAALDLTQVERPLLERAWARAKIASLLEGTGDRGPKEGVAEQVIALSTAHRVLSPYTSLLVLETDADFARFRVDRKALADVLTVDHGRLAVAKRSTAPIPSSSPEERLSTVEKTPPVVRPPAAPDARTLDVPTAPRLEVPHAELQRPASGADGASARGSMWGSDVGDSFGAGGLGLSGVGEGGGGRGASVAGPALHEPAKEARGSAAQGSGQGFGSGHGRLGGAHAALSPAPRASAGATVSGSTSPMVIQAVVRRNMEGARRCYNDALRADPALGGRVVVRLVIARDGKVASSNVGELRGLSQAVADCVARSMLRAVFPAPEGGTVTVMYPIVFGPNPDAPARDRTVVLPPVDVAPDAVPPPPSAPSQKRAQVEPYSGRFKSVMDLVGAGGAKPAIDMAYAWHREAPGDVMALVALGEALERAKEPSTAARVYGSIVDLFPARADLRRFAGERLERLGDVGAAAAIDTFLKAEDERPDHPEGHRLVAYARLRQGDPEAAFEAALRGVKQPYPRGRFQGVDRILREDLGLIAAAWIKVAPGRREEILQKLAEAGGTREDGPSLRFVLSWETDANDVDFHIHDARGGHAYFNHPELESGGRLYADVTTGYGPECFTIRTPKDQRAAPYQLFAHYYSRGPMGYGMGKVEIIDHDGQGGLTFEERPFVVMADGAYVDLGSYPR